MLTTLQVQPLHHSHWSISLQPLCKRFIIISSRAGRRSTPPEIRGPSHPLKVYFLNDAPGGGIDVLHCSDQVDLNTVAHLHMMRRRHNKKNEMTKSLQHAKQMHYVLHMRTTFPSHIK